MSTFDTPLTALAVFAAGLAAGAANAVAGGGSALAFPVLVLAGVPPIAANATNALGLWPGSIAAAWSYRARIRRIRPRTRRLIPPALIGGLLGAWLLIQLPPESFAAVAPFLVIAAGLSVGVEPLIRRWLGGREGGRNAGRRGVGIGATIAMFGVAMYGGYFGAGIGLILLTTLGLLGLEDLQHANGIKNFMAVVIKAPAIVYFVAIGAALWDASLVLAAGAIAGGWLGGHLIQKVDARRLRWVIALIGLVLGLLMLVRPAPASAQLRPMEPVDWALLADDDWTAGLHLGAALYDEHPASLAAVTGRLYELGVVDASWKVGTVVLQLSGVGQRVLRADSTHGQPVKGVQPREAGDPLWDVGEVRVSTLVPLYRRPGLRTLLRFGTRLPVTDSEAGLDRDQTDFFALLGARARHHHTTLAAEAGLGIHGTHGRGYYEQVDVLLYSAELAHRLGWLRTSLSLVGQMEGLEGHTVRGNEDLQEVRLALQAGERRWVRLEGVRGLRTFSPEWGLRVGVGARW